MVPPTNNCSSYCTRQDSSSYFIGILVNQRFTLSIGQSCYEEAHKQSLRYELQELVLSQSHLKIHSLATFV